MRRYFIEILIFIFFITSYACSVKNIRKGESTIRPLDQETLDISGSFTSTIDVKAYLSGSNQEILPEVKRFYQNRDFRLAWFTNDERLSTAARVLLDDLHHPEEKGLPFNYYTVYPIDKSLLKQNKVPDLKTPPSLAREIDVLLTEAYFTYASNLSSGIIDPDKLNVIWKRHIVSIDLVKHLEQALQTNTIAESLEALQPGHDAYRRLLESYREFKRKQEADWPVPGNFKSLEEGDISSYVIKLKKFLKASGDLQKTDSLFMNIPLYDPTVKAAVTSFQSRHGLETDGIIGKMTLAEMNRPLEYRLNQLLINLDRNRWLPENPGERYILINIPDYTLKYYGSDGITQSMKVVVGKLENYTPVLKDSMSYIVFNPSWNVPYSIASKEMLPKLKADSSYLRRNNYILLRGSYRSIDTLQAENIDWSVIKENSFPFFVVQKPGGGNALGKIKFMMPNIHAIYLHDTPSGYLFNKAQRDFSHGCIRLQEPVELAQNILKNQLSADSIQAILKSKKETVVVLKQKVLVHFIYQTAWVDILGQVQFRNDVYNFDKKSVHLLKGY